MEARVGQDIVIVVVTNGLLVHICGEGPEAIDGHLFTEAQGCTDQKQSRRQALGMDSPALPELSNTPQKVGVSEKHCLIGTNVFQCVIYTERGLCSCLHRKSRHVYVAMVIDLHVVHKRLSGPEQVLKPMENKSLNQTSETQTHQSPLTLSSDGSSYQTEHTHNTSPETSSDTPTYQILLP